MRRRVERRQAWPCLVISAVSLVASGAFISVERPSFRSRTILHAATEPSSPSSPGSLPVELVTGVLAEPGHFQTSFLMSFVKYCGDRWTSSEDLTESAQATTRDALVAATFGFLQRGSEETQMWQDYLQQELGRVIGDPYAFDLRIKILDNGARKALKRAARQAMMDEMLAKSKAKRNEIEGATA